MEENKSYQEQKVCYLFKKQFNVYYKEYHKVRDHGVTLETKEVLLINICNLRYKTRKGIPIVFHNGSKYDYHFITKEVAE